MRRLVFRLAVAALVLAAGLALLFPTDAVVRSLLARFTPPGLLPPAFERAHLTPAGVSLANVTIARDGRPPVITAAHVLLRPSLLGLVLGRRGHPWAFDADACGGTATGTVAAEGATTVADLDFDAVDLGVCPLLELAGAALAGHARGSAHVRLDPAAPAKGNGQLDLADVVWRGQGVLALFRATAASWSWRLEEGKLTLASIDVRMPALLVRGAGEVLLTEPLGASDLRLALTLTPADGSEGPRPMLVAGTLARPQLVGQ